MTLPAHHLRPDALPHRSPPRSGAAARLSVRMRPVPGAPAAARRLVREACAQWRLPAPLAEEAATVAGVLVLTSVHQVHSVLRLTIMAGVERSGRGTVLIEVEDPGREDVAARPPSPPWAVDNLTRLAADSGSARMPGGRQLWARVGAKTGPLLAAVPGPGRGATVR